MEETYPAQAQFRALRVAATVLLQLAADLKEDAEARQIVAIGVELSDLDADLIAQAVTNLAQELDLRAEQVYQANVRYLELFARRN